MSNKVLNPCAVCTQTEITREVYFVMFVNIWLHVSCTSPSVRDNNALSCVDDDWYCQKCLIDIFPSNCIEDEIEYANCTFNLLNCNKLNAAWNKNSQLNIINKFITLDKDIDPDYNFFKGNCKYNNYYLEDEFNDLVLNNNLNNNFSIRHINARSLNKNIKNIKN